MADQQMHAPQIEHNKTIQANWGVFNIPTIAGLLAILLMIWNGGAAQERQDARLDAIELNRVQRSTEINKVLEALQTKVSPVDNLAYRVTVLEQGVADVNRRIDRIGDAMQNIRSDIGELSSKVDVLTEQVRATLPKKAALSDMPSEFR